MDSVNDPEKHRLAKVCQSCLAGTEQLLMFIKKVGEPPGHPQHQIVYEHLQLYQCDLCLRGRVEREKHDCFDWEAVWTATDDFWIDAVVMADVRHAMVPCPRPAD